VLNFESGEDVRIEVHPSENKIIRLLLPVNYYDDNPQKPKTIYEYRVLTKLPTKYQF
jgi:hypothetical protein